MMAEDHKPKTWADVAYNFTEALVYIAFIALLGFMFHECASCEKARDIVKYQQQIEKNYD